MSSKSDIPKNTGQKEADKNLENKTSNTDDRFQIKMNFGEKDEEDKLADEEEPEAKRSAEEEIKERDEAEARNRAEEEKRQKDNAEVKRIIKEEQVVRKKLRLKRKTQEENR